MPSKPTKNIEAIALQQMNEEKRRGPEKIALNSSRSQLNRVMIEHILHIGEADLLIISDTKQESAKSKKLKRNRHGRSS